MSDELIAREREEARAQRRELTDMAHADAQARRYSSWLSNDCLLRERTRMQQADMEARAGLQLTTSAGAGQTEVNHTPCEATQRVPPRGQLQTCRRPQIQWML